MSFLFTAVCSFFLNSSLLIFFFPLPFLLYVQWLSYSLDEQGSIPSTGKEFSLRHSVQASSGDHPVSPRDLSLGVKWPGSEANLSPQCTTAVNNTCNCISTVSYIFMTWCLINYNSETCQCPFNCLIHVCHCRDASRLAGVKETSRCRRATEVSLSVIHFQPPCG
jgi:hypothetical protein